MNCEKAEKYILLMDSGELSARRKADLEAHITSCAACREYRKDLRAVAGAAGVMFPAREPSQEVITRILSSARDSRPLRLLVWFRQPAMQVIALAASILILFGIWMNVSTQEGRRARVREWNAIAALISGSELGAPAKGTNMERREREINSLAQMLLRLEGLAVEEVAEIDMSILLGEPSPTALQLNSIPVRQA